MQNSIFASSKLQFRQRHKHSKLGMPLPYQGLKQKTDSGMVKLRMATIRWARNIPSTIRPRELVIQFPQIANSLAEAWDQPRVFALLINHYLTGEGKRQHNFPETVRQDLIQLKLYFCTLQASSYMMPDVPKDMVSIATHKDVYQSLYLELQADECQGK